MKICIFFGFYTINGSHPLTFLFKLLLKMDLNASIDHLSNLSGFRFELAPHSNVLVSTLLQSHHTIGSVDNLARIWNKIDQNNESGASFLFTYEQ